MVFTKPSPPTDEELAGLEKLQPGDYEIYSERINMILAECKDVFQRVGNSDWVMSGDLIVGLQPRVIWSAPVLVPIYTVSLPRTPSSG